MEKRIHKSTAAGSHKSIKLTAILLLAVTFQGLAADEFYYTISADFTQEIKQQRVAALEEVTRELQQSRNWSKLGVKELVTTLKQQTVKNILNNGRRHAVHQLRMSGHIREGWGSIVVEQMMQVYPLRHLLAGYTNLTTVTNRYNPIQIQYRPAPHLRIS